MWFDNSHPEAWFTGPRGERLTLWSRPLGTTFVYVVTLAGERIGTYRRKADAKRAILRKFPGAKQI
jgi:hypothetical protein